VSSEKKDEEPEEKDIHMEGYLFIRKQLFGVSHWSRRYSIIYQDLLIFSKKEQRLDKQHFSFGLNLKNSSLRPLFLDKPFSFEVSSSLG